MQIAQTRDRLYEFINGEGEQDVCDEIPESACSLIPKNFTLNAINGLGTKLADQLASPGLVLAWFMDALGIPVSMIGYLNPVRRAAALLPQLFVSGQIRQMPVRKWFWVAGGAVFGLALLLMVPAAVLLPAFAAGIGIMVLLAAGSIGRGFSSVAYKEVLAKTIPQGSRGRLLAVRATAGGLLALLAGIFIKTQVGAGKSIMPYLLLIAAAGGLWMISLVPVVLVEEHPGATAGARDPFEETRSGIKLFKQHAGYRSYIFTRGILVSVELSLPFYALYVRQATGGGTGELGIFIIAASLSQLLSSPFWGLLSDRTSRWTLMLSALLAGLAGVFILLVNRIPIIADNPYVLALPVIIIGFAIAGVRLGRNVYLVDAAPADDRALYVALSNTIAGGLILLGGGLGFIADSFGIQILIGVLAALAFTGAISSWLLPEAQQMT